MYLKTSESNVQCMNCTSEKLLSILKEYFGKSGSRRFKRTVDVGTVNPMINPRHRLTQPPRVGSSIKGSDEVRGFLQLMFTSPTRDARRNKTQQEETSLPWPVRWHRLCSLPPKASGCEQIHPRKHSNACLDSVSSETPLLPQRLKNFDSFGNSLSLMTDQ